VTADLDAVPPGDQAAAEAAIEEAGADLLAVSTRTGAAMGEALAAFPDAMDALEPAVRAEHACEGIVSE
jgi:hypothetical protein